MKEINFDNLFSLDNKSILITGAMGFLGKEIVLALSQFGGNFILTDLSNSVNENFLQEIQNKVRYKFFPCDLENEDDRENFLNNLKDSYGSIDVVINNAAFVGTSSLEGWAADFHNQNTVAWRRAIEVNLTAPFEIIQFLSKTKMLGKGSSIINIGSIYSFKAPKYSLYKDTEIKNPAAYAASKGGLLQLTRWLSTTLASNTRVNSISLGGVFRNQNPTFVERYIKKTPLQRMAKENDIDGLIIFLATNMSEYITGQNFVIDGGWSIVN